MVTFIKKNGDILILHNYFFSIVEMKHKFDMIYIFDGKIREEKNLEVSEKYWEIFIKKCGVLQNKPLTVDLEV